MRMIIGIDPGAQGALAWWDKESGFCVELLEDNPLRWLQELQHAPSVHVLIEKAQAMPGQGVCSMFNYGTGFGKILGWCEALKLPHTLITPREWTKEMHKGCTAKTAKEKSVQAVSRLFPNFDLRPTPKSKKPHLGLVDALLICEYARRHFQ